MKKIPTRMLGGLLVLCCWIAFSQAQAEVNLTKSPQTLRDQARDLWQKGKREQALVLLGQVMQWYS